MYVSPYFAEKIAYYKEMNRKEVSRKNFIRVKSLKIKDDS